jgi:hypothetical protein
MPRRLSLLNVVLVGASLAFALLIARELTTAPRPVTSRAQPATPAAVPAAPAAPPPPPAGGYTIIATRNLFSPTRTEAPPPPPTVSAAMTLPKPSLYGVVLRDGAPIAYLEDPVTKRVGSYRIGDTVAGGTVTTITDDSVMLARPEGQVAIRLHDPTRPRPPAPSAPGGPTPPTSVVPQGTSGALRMPAVQPTPGGVPFTRPVPGSVLRRIPSPQATDVPTTQ